MNFLLIQSAGEHPENAEFRECLCLQRGLIANGHNAVVRGKGHDIGKTSVECEPTGIADEMLVNSITIPASLGSCIHWADAIVTLEQYPDKADWLPDLASVKKPKLLWAIDVHCRGLGPYSAEYKRGKYTAMLRSTLDKFLTTEHWFPNAYDDTLIGPRQCDKGKVGFVGNLGGNERSDFMFKLQKEFGSDFYWLRALGEDMVQTINKFEVHWNMNIADDINYRCFETIGCGVPLVTNSRGPAHDEQYKRLGFVNGVNCAIYRTYDECVDAIKWLLSNRDHALTWMGDAGLELAARHTYKERAKQLVEIVEGL